METLLLTLVLPFIIIVYGLVWGLLSEGKAADEAIKRALDEYLERKKE